MVSRSVAAYTCPVCGYPELEEDPEYIASFEICHCCAFHFRVSDDDRHFTYVQWREKWIAGGMVWDKGSSTPILNWDPKKQLRNIGINLPEIK